MDTVVNDFLHFEIVQVSAPHQQADTAVEFLCLWPKMVGIVVIVIVVGVRFNVINAVIVWVGTCGFFILLGFSMLCSSA